MDPSARPGYLDFLFYAFILIVCYFSFNHPDLLSPAVSSFTYLNGHIKDFYAVNSALELGNNYLPSSYILFAIWNIPVKLLGIAASLDAGYLIFWYKLLTTLFLAAAGFLMYKIGRSIGLSKKDSRLLTIIWFSSPILFFGQFIFGQIDIFTVFFTLAGLYYLLQKRLILFTLFFAIAATFKYFPFFIFLPLLLLIEKRPFKLAGYLFLSLLPAALETLFYLGSPEFVSGVIGFIGAGPRIFQAHLSVFQGVSIYLFPCLWFVICGVCFYTDLSKDKFAFYQASLYVCLAVLCLLFALIFWGPQWLTFLTPFLAINLFMNKRIKSLLLLDFIMMIAFVGYVVSIFPMNVDQQLFSCGVLGKFNPDLFVPEKTLIMKAIFSPLEVNFASFYNIYFTLFCATLILYVLLNFPSKDNAWKGPHALVPVNEYWSYARLRFFGGVAIFILPAFFVYLYAFFRYR
ncbi:MAG: hypothetical protein V1869_01380 [Candidatus Omnitrophota bacterium]